MTILNLHAIHYKIKSTNVLMPRWSSRALVYTECITIHDCWQLLACMQVKVVFKCSQAAVGLCTQAEQWVYTEDLVIQ